MSIAITVGLGALGALLGPPLDRAIDRFPRHQPAMVPADTAQPPPEVRSLEPVEALSTSTVTGGDRHGDCTDECRRPLPNRAGTVTVILAALFALAGLRITSTWDLVPGLVMITALVPLAFTDYEHLLLPRRLVWCGVATLCATLIVATAATGDAHRLLQAVLAALAATAALAVVSFANPRWMAFGDVRLTVLVGLGVGWTGPWHVVGALLVANLCAAAVGGLLWAVPRTRHVRHLPFGIFLTLGAIALTLLSG